MNILLTGASRGLGLIMTERLLANGHTVFGVSRSKSGPFTDLQKSHPEQLHFCAFDLADAGNIKDEIFDQFIGADTPLHGFINNAATAYDDIITNLKIEPLQEMYQVNVISPFMMVRNVIRNALLHQVPSSIVHISSISVHTGYKGLSMYASTKGALEAFSKNTAREWGSRGIRSNAIVAGFMETDMSSTLSAEQKERIYKRTALKEATRPESVADMAAFLLSEKAASVTGQNLFVDSGTI